MGVIGKKSLRSYLKTRMRIGSRESGCIAHSDDVTLQPLQHAQGMLFLTWNTFDIIKLLSESDGQFPELLRWSQD